MKSFNLAVGYLMDSALNFSLLDLQNESHRNHLKEVAEALYPGFEALPGHDKHATKDYIIACYESAVYYLIENEKESLTSFDVAVQVVSANKHLVWTRKEGYPEELFEKVRQSIQTNHRHLLQWPWVRDTKINGFSIIIAYHYIHDNQKEHGSN